MYTYWWVHVYLVFPVITVGLDNTTYTVPEDGGVVQVCVEILEGELEQEAEVTLSTNDGSAAGIYVRS